MFITKVSAAEVIKGLLIVSMKQTMKPIFYLEVEQRDLINSVADSDNWRHHLVVEAKHS